MTRPPPPLDERIKFLYDRNARLERRAAGVARIFRGVAAVKTLARPKATNCALPSAALAPSARALSEGEALS